MMELVDRPRRTSSTPTTTSELFICFTSRLSNSSSMRLTSSKSILSPGRSSDKSLSLSTSLSRRLRHNGSLRGAQSPAMLKTRGAGPGFDNPEPSSPKVTCIGQVRVKTKKQGKKMKMRACRSKRLSASAGEASFRRIEHSSTHDGLMQQSSHGHTQGDRNQRWVHLPLTICEALRGFGSCKSSCFGSCGGGKVKERDESNNGGSCGAVFRWLVAMQEGEGDGKERDIELVVGDEEIEDGNRREKMVMGSFECSSRRRSIFDDMEFKDEMFDGGMGGEEEEGGRVSICIPPKNALLLMRCRSDPAKMANLSHRVWEPPVVAHHSDYEEDEEDDGEKEEGVVKGVALDKMEEKMEDVCDKREKLGVGSGELDEMCEDSAVVADDEEQGCEMGSQSQDLGSIPAEEESESKTEETQDEEETEEKQSTQNRANSEQQLGVTPEEQEEQQIQLMEDENEPNRCSIDAITIRKMFEEGDWMKNIKQRAKISDLSSSSSSSSSSAEESTVQSRDEEEKEENDKEFVKSMEDQQQEEQKDPVVVESQLLQKEEEEEKEKEKELPLPVEEGRKSSAFREESQPYTPPFQRPEFPPEPAPTHQKPDPVLPDCLLLMMCEPKLSMEVSKETWVCSTDFIRWLPERHHSKKPTKSDGPDEPKKKKKPAPQPAVQPGRSSISFPAVGLDQKAVKAAGYEPFVLTRCKSAPMRSTATELACRENRRKMEPHRPAVGAAGVGF